MKLYHVIKPKLNIRNRVVNLTDDSYVGHLLNGSYFWGDEELIQGDAPKGTSNNLYIKEQNGNFVSFAGVREGYLPDSIVDLGLDDILFDPTLKKGDGVNVIVIDSGYNNYLDDTDGPTIAQQINCSGLDNSVTDTLGHGTLMATIIGGKSERRQGLAPNSKITVIKYNNGDQANLDKKFNQALEKANEIAIGDPEKFFLINCSNSAIYSSRQKRIVDPILDVSSNLPNALFFCSAGNDGIFDVDFNRINLVPCYKNGILSVSSSVRVIENTLVQQRWNTFSNYWTGISINVPGSYRSEFLNDKIPSVMFESSTSNACAFIVGLVALYISQDPAEINKKEKCLEFINSVVTDVSEPINSQLVPVKKINKLNIKNCFRKFKH